jgi:hypothetical protein
MDKTHMHPFDVAESPGAVKCGTSNSYDKTSISFSYELTRYTFPGSEV